MTAKKNSSQKSKTSNKKTVATPKKTKKKGAAAENRGRATSTGLSKNKEVARGFFVVGIGASAGGLEALESLLKAMPQNTGMAFVVVTHQHPDHSSLLPELLGKSTSLPVVRAEEGLRVEPNRIYVNPPGVYLSILNGLLHTMPAPKNEIPPLPIDSFFRSLAQDQKERAICIILSGAGSDGTIGLKAVKNGSGMAIVQDVQSARYMGMPQSAIATTLADHVLKPSAMPAQLTAYAKVFDSRKQHNRKAVKLSPDLEKSIQKIFVLLRTRTGNDFSSYKPNTMHRRVERRMMVHEIKKANEYVRFLQENPHEIDLLFKELLIGVTSFFRDPGAFQFLAEKIIPDLLSSRPDNYVFRVWIPGSGSGEEAYTIAMVLRECARKAQKPLEFQIFATDLDSRSIESAREGSYPAGIAADVPNEYLKLYFTHDGAVFRIRKEIREMVVFAEQNVIKDPPFSKLDLISCRNLLIYLNSELQKRLLPIFHYALRPGGMLLLGMSESMGSHTDLFETVDNKWKIYRRKETHPAKAAPEMPAQPLIRELKTPATEIPDVSKIRPSMINKLEKLLLQRFVPTSVIATDQGDVVYIHGRSGKYLEPASGQASMNLYNMAREGLKIQLMTAIRQILSGKKQVIRKNIRVKTNGDYLFTDLSVTLIEEPESLRGLLLITFTPDGHLKPERKTPEKGKKTPAVTGNESRIAELECEVQHTRESLQITVEELETSNEELTSSIEELQSTNEELQSSNEELETSREEMQSLNEELTTVNTELESKVDELSYARDDMQNLLNSTNIATLFLDNNLNIKRYTEPTTKLIKLRPGDSGRPIDEIVTSLEYDRLIDDMREVLEKQKIKEVELRSRGNGWHLVRIIPYRTRENVFDGLVITFTNIDKIKKSEQMEDERDFFSSIVETIREPIVILDSDLHIVMTNSSFCTTFNYAPAPAPAPADIEQRLIFEITDRQWDIPELHKLLEEILTKNNSFSDFKVETDFPRVGGRVFLLNARRLLRAKGKPAMILLAIEDITDVPKKPITGTK